MAHRPKWYNYIGIFTSDEYGTFLATYQLNPSCETKKDLIDLVYEMYEEEVWLVARGMILLALHRKDIVITNGVYVYNGGNYSEFVRFEDVIQRGEYREVE